MADVRLDFYDLDEGALPDVCMKCGAPSVARPVKQFSWMPYWARWMPPIIGIWFIKRRRVPIPLCEQHKNHWTVRYLVGIGGIFLVLALILGGGVLFAMGQDDDPSGPLAMGGVLLMAVGGVLFIAWLITMIALASTQINVAEITEDTILMKNVHNDFTQAYREATRPASRPRWTTPSATSGAGRPAGGARSRAGRARTTRRATSISAGDRGLHGRPADRHTRHQGRRVPVHPRPPARGRRGRAGARRRRAGAASVCGGRAARGGVRSGRRGPRSPAHGRRPRPGRGRGGAGRP